MNGIRDGRKIVSPLGKYQLGAADAGGLEKNFAAKILAITTIAHNVTFFKATKTI